MAKFPKMIYVTHEDEGSENDYFNVNEDVPDVDENKACGIYELVEKAEIVVTRAVKKIELKRALRKGK